MEDVASCAQLTLSSFKNGYSLDELMASDTDLYWNSDGKAPHFIHVKFKTLTVIKELQLNLNYEKDESYTPNRILIRAGYSEYDAVLLLERDIVKPKGWISFDFTATPVTSNEMSIKDCGIFYMYIAFPYNYLNGKDLRVRGIRLLSPAVTANLPVTSKPKTSPTITKKEGIDIEGAAFDALIESRINSILR